jgi:putative membrane protein
MRGEERDDWRTAGREPDPRWSLANERTLLAYERTALGFVVAGFAIVGSNAVSDTPAWLAAIGIPLIVLGGVVAVYGRRRFVAAQLAMRTGQPLPPPKVLAVLPAGVALVAAAGVVLAIVQLLFE